MRVAWDLQAITGPRPTGLGVSVGFLLEAAKSYCSKLEIVELRPNNRNLPLARVTHRLAWEQFRLPAALRRCPGLDCCYSPALGAPMFSPVPVVAHVHDLIPLKYPGQFSGFARWYWEKHLPGTWKRCAALTVSNETVADDISRLLWFPRDRIHIVPYYPDPELTDIADAIRQELSEQNGARSVLPLFLTIATLEPRKNIELAIRALALLKNRGIVANLECIGGTTAHQTKLAGLVAELGLDDQVRFSGYLDRRQIVEKLLGCTALLFVSRYEGFGMPPLEAMSIGTAVVLSDIDCHRSVYHDQQRISASAVDPLELPALVNFDDPAELAGEMERLITDQTYLAGLRTAGCSYSATFTATDTAAALQSAFTAAVNS